MVGVAFAAILAASVQAASNPTGMDCKLGYDELLKRISSEPGTNRQITPESAPYLVYDDKGSYVIYTFTRQTAPAHPAVVKRAIVGAEKGIDISTSICCYADQVSCDGLARTFKDMDQRVKEKMKADHRP